MGSAVFLPVFTADPQRRISMALPDSGDERQGELCYSSRAASLETVGDENNPANNRRAQLLLNDANLHVV